MSFAAKILEIAFFLLPWTVAFSQVQQNSVPSDVLKSYVRKYLSRGDKSPFNNSARINVVQVKTAAGMTESFVYVSGQGWCGSGGCTMLILESAGSTFKMLGDVSIVQLPIRILESTNHGRPDIGVTVYGGGILTPYEAVLSFDGRRYPENPSLVHARRGRRVRGKVILANTSNSVPLYE